MGVWQTGKTERALLQIFDTNSWERRETLPGLPKDAIAYSPSSQSAKNDGRRFHNDAGFEMTASGINNVLFSLHHNADMQTKKAARIIPRRLSAFKPLLIDPDTDIGSVVAFVAFGD